MLKFDEKTGYLTLPGLRDAIRVREDGRIEGAAGWTRFATDEEEAMYAALRAAPNPSAGEGPTPVPHALPAASTGPAQPASDGVEQHLSVCGRCGYQAVYREVQPAPGVPLIEGHREWCTCHDCMAISKAIHERERPPAKSQAVATGRECWVPRHNGLFEWHLACGFKPEPTPGYEWVRMVEAAAPTPALPCGCVVDPSYWFCPKHQSADAHRAPGDGPSPGTAWDASRLEEPVDADLQPFGWAPGNYLAVCHDCQENMEDVDKRARLCRPCAAKRFKAQKTAQPSRPEGEGPSPSSSPSLPAMDLEAAIERLGNLLPEPPEPGLEGLEASIKTLVACLDLEVREVNRLRDFLRGVEEKEAEAAAQSLVTAPAALPLPRPMTIGVTENTLREALRAIVQRVIMFKYPGPDSASVYVSHEELATIANEALKACGEGKDLEPSRGREGREDAPSEPNLSAEQVLRAVYDRLRPVTVSSRGVDYINAVCDVLDYHLTPYVQAPKAGSFPPVSEANGSNPPPESSPGPSPQEQA